MKAASPTINEVLAEFLAAEKRRLSPRTYRRYEEVIALLRSSLDAYAYESLARDERALWEKRRSADEAAGSYCNTFGPDKIPAEAPGGSTWKVFEPMPEARARARCDATGAASLAHADARRVHSAESSHRTTSSSGSGFET